MAVGACAGPMVHASATARSVTLAGRASASLDTTATTAVCIAIATAHAAAVVFAGRKACVSASRCMAGMTAGHARLACTDLTAVLRVMRV